MFIYNKKITRVILSFFVLFFFLSCFSSVFAATQIKTVEFFIDQKLGSGTIAAGSFWDSNTATINLPESNISIKDAWVQIEYLHTISTESSTNVTIQFPTGTQVLNIPGAVFVSSGELGTVVLKADVTSFFQGKSFPLDVNVSVSNATAISSSHNAKVFITYTYEDTGISQLKTVKYPIDSNTNFFSNVGPGGLLFRFDYNATSMDINAVKSVWFELGGAYTANVNDIDGNISARIQSDPFSSYFVDNNGNPNNFFNFFFRPNPGTFAMNTSQTLDVNVSTSASTTDIMMLGGELSVTYDYNSLKPIQTKTVRYFIGQDTVPKKGTPVNFTKIISLPDSGASVQAVWARVRSCYTSNTATNYDVDANVGSTSVAQKRFVIDSDQDIAHGFMLTYNMSAAKASVVNDVNVSISVASSQPFECPPGVELFVTYDYTSSSTTLLKSIGFFAGMEKTSTRTSFVGDFNVTIPQTEFSVSKKSGYLLADFVEKAIAGVLDYNIQTSISGSSLLDVNMATSGENVTHSLLNGDASNVVSAADGNYTVLYEDSNATFSGAFFLTYSFIPYQAPDINIVAIDTNLDSGTLPVYSYVKDGNLTIDLNVLDDTNSLLVDLNYSSTTTNGSGTVIVNDLNIVALGSSGSLNCQDTNFNNSTRCSIDFNIFGVADGNYYLLALIYDGTLTDYNFSDQNFMIDNTGPSLTISSPANNSSTTDTTITVQYSATDSGTGVKKYYVSSDGSTWIDNGTTTTYAFTNQSVGAHTYYVIATDNVDNNSSAQVNVTIGAQQSSGGGPGNYIYCYNYGYAYVCNENEMCPGTLLMAHDVDLCCSVNCVSVESQPDTEPGQPETEPEAEPELASYSVSYSSNLVEGGLRVFEDSMAEIELKQQRIATEQDVHFKRNASVSQKIVGGKIVYVVLVELAVENISDVTLRNVELFENVSKELVSTASKIRQVNQEFEVVEDDPIIKFYLGDINPSQVQVVSYEFELGFLIGENDFSVLLPPIALIDLSESDSCELVFCNDYNPCTVDSCSNETCSYVFAPEKKPCGVGLHCVLGECVEKSGQPVAPEEVIDEGGFGFIWPIIGVVLVLVVVSLGVIVWLSKTALKKN